MPALVALAASYQDERWLPRYGKEVLARHRRTSQAPALHQQMPQPAHQSSGSEMEIMSDTLRESVAAEAEAILLRVVHTVYQHETYVDVATGTYDMDCSGYVGYVLQRIAPEHYQTIPPDNAAGRPLAFDFYDLFSGLPPEGADGWRPVPPLADVRRGDIVAWRSELLEPGENTGHVFIVADDPEIFDDGVTSILAYDSSNILHYDDTRGQGGDSPATGVGRGRLHFRLGSSGWEFQFGPGDAYHECPIAVGRIEPLGM